MPNQNKRVLAITVFVKISSGLPCPFSSEGQNGFGLALSPIDDEPRFVEDLNELKK